MFYTYMGEVGYSQKKTNRVQNVWFSAAVESCDGVKQRVEVVDLRPLSVGFESFDDDRFYMHLLAFLRSATTETRLAMSGCQNRLLKTTATCSVYNRQRESPFSCLLAHLNFGGMQSTLDVRSMPETWWRKFCHSKKNIYVFDALIHVWTKCFIHKDVTVI